MLVAMTRKETDIFSCWALFQDISQNYFCKISNDPTLHMQGISKLQLGRFLNVMRVADKLMLVCMTVGYQESPLPPVITIAHTTSSVWSWHKIITLGGHHFCSKIVLGFPYSVHQSHWHNMVHLSLILSILALLVSVSMSGKLSSRAGRQNTVDKGIDCLSYMIHFYPPVVVA